MAKVTVTKYFFRGSTLNVEKVKTGKFVVVSYSSSGEYCSAYTPIQVFDTEEEAYQWMKDIGSETTYEIDEPYMPPWSMDGFWLKLGKT